MLPPATSCRHMGQMYCSDMLHIFQHRFVAAAPNFTADPHPTHACKRRYPAPPDVKHALDLRYTTFSVDLRLQRGGSQPILTNKRTKLARERSLGPPDGKHVQGLCYISFSVNLRLQRGASQPILTQQTHKQLARGRSLGPPDAKRAHDLCYTSCSVDLWLQHGAWQPFATLPSAHTRTTTAIGT